MPPTGKRTGRSPPANRLRKPRTARKTCRHRPDERIPGTGCVNNARRERRDMEVCAVRS